MSLRTLGKRAMLWLRAVFAVLFVKAEAAVAPLPDEATDLPREPAAEIPRTRPA